MNRSTLGELTEWCKSYAIDVLCTGKAYQEAKGKPFVLSSTADPEWFFLNLSVSSNAANGGLEYFLVENGKLVLGRIPIGPKGLTLTEFTDQLLKMRLTDGMRAVQVLPFGNEFHFNVFEGKAKELADLVRICGLQK